MKWVGGKRMIVQIKSSTTLFNKHHCLFFFSEHEEKAPILPNENLLKIRKSLNFSKPSNEDSNSNGSFPDHEASRKRQQDEMFGSLSDDDDLCSKGIQFNSINKQLIPFNYSYFSIKPIKKVKEWWNRFSCGTRNRTFTSKYNQFDSEKLFLSNNAWWATSAYYHPFWSKTVCAIEV